MDTSTATNSGSPAPPAIPSPPALRTIEAGLCARLVLWALGAGIAADLLLRAYPWGLNFALFALLWTIGAETLAAQAKSVAHPMGRRVWLLLACLFALAMAWRDSTFLKVLDTGLVGLCVALAAWQAEGARLWQAGLSAYALKGLRFVGDALGGVVSPLAQTVRCGAKADLGWLRTAGALLKGVVLAVPLLLVFGALFASADAVFRVKVLGWLRFDLESLFKHTLVVAAAAWLVGGTWRGTMDPTPLSENLSGHLRWVRLGKIELTVVLGALNVLFASFLLVQLHYFFGGAHQVEVMPGLTYAQYARRGFFELVTVAALLLPVLLSVDWLSRHEPHKRWVRLLSLTLVGMLFVIMASAMQRMRLYQLEYGLTELRFYASALMCWLAVVFLWFAVTLCRQRRQEFAFGALVVGLFMSAALHGVNPDAWIARTNLQRASEGKFLDVDYLTSLSADAVPAVLGTWAGLDATTRQAIQLRSQRHWADLWNPDWRAWSWSRWRARNLLMQAGWKPSLSQPQSQTRTRLSPIAAEAKEGEAAPMPKTDDLSDLWRKDAHVGH